MAGVLGITTPTEFKSWGKKQPTFYNWPAVKYETQIPGRWINFYKSENVILVNIVTMQ